MSRIPSHRPLPGTPPSAQRAGYPSPVALPAGYETPPAVAGSPFRTPPAFEQQGVSRTDVGLSSPPQGAGRGWADLAAALPPPPPLRRRTFTFSSDLPINARSSRLPAFPVFSMEEGFSTPASNFSQIGRGAYFPRPRAQARPGQLLNVASQSQRSNVESREDRSGLNLLVRATAHLGGDRPGATADLPQPDHRAHEPQERSTLPQIPLLLDSPGVEANEAAGLPGVQGRFRLAPRSTQRPDLQG